MYSQSISNLISAFKKLPSVGARTAERYVFHLLNNGKGEVNELRAALSELLSNTKSCEICWNFTDSSPCSICANKQRDHSVICVVVEPQDIPIMEKAGAVNCVYHVLRDTIDPSKLGKTRFTKVKELLTRIKSDRNIKEVILALNPDLPGETTAMYIEKLITNLNKNIRVTRLARGLPMGSDLQYADEITLASALKNRK